MFLSRNLPVYILCSRSAETEDNVHKEHHAHIRPCLIGTNSENGRLGRLGICVRLTPEFRIRQVWQVWKACLKRQKIWQTSERFPSPSAEL